MTNSGRDLMKLSARVLAMSVMFGAVWLIPSSAEASASSANPSAIVARVDGVAMPVAHAARHDDVSLRAGDVQLCVVDLAAAALPATAIEFELTRTQVLTLEVLDLEGNLIKTLADGLWAQGQHQLAWQHDAESGTSLEAGLFVVRLVPESEGEMVALAR